MAPYRGRLRFGHGDSTALVILDRLLSTHLVKSRLVAVVVCVVALDVSFFAPSFGSTAVSGAAATTHSHMGGPCRGNAHYTLDVDRSSEQISFSFSVYGRAWTDWQYRAEMRNGTRSIRDHGTLTVGPGSDPHWTVSFTWLRNRIRPRIVVAVRGDGPAGQLCRARFVQQPR